MCTENENGSDSYMVTNPWKTVKITTYTNDACTEGAEVYTDADMSDCMTIDDDGDDVYRTWEWRGDAVTLHDYNGNTECAVESMSAPTETWFVGATKDECLMITLDGQDTYYQIEI